MNNLVSKILLVEDHKTVSESLRMLLENNNYDVTTCNDANFALKLLPTDTFDLIITDIEMPKLNGVDFIKHVRSSKENTIKILVLSTHANNSLINQLFNLKVNGYINKSSSSLDLLQAIRYILDGKNYFPNEVTSYLSDNDSSDGNSEIKFTKRELDVLKLILNEITTREIAEKLNISVSTVEEHRRNLLLKTNSKNVVGLVKYCIVNQVL